MALVTMSADDVAKLQDALCQSRRRGFWSPLANHESTYALACCAVTLLCVLAANPFGGAGFDDDWSYSHLALKFAQTGHVQYDGWGSPTLLFQALWAAPWIRLLGFSFDLMRVITIPFALGFVAVVYATGRAVGLRQDLSFFAALTTSTTPLFLPVAASFMTDAYGCFFCGSCVYAAIRSAAAETSRSAVFWLRVLAACGILGGSDRQIVWAAPALLIPYVFSTRRSDKRFLINSVAAYSLCIAVLAFISAKFTPPYAPFASKGRDIWQVFGGNVPLALVLLLSLCLTTLLAALPALLCFAHPWRQLGVVRIVAIAVVSIIATLLMAGFLGEFGTVPFAQGLLSQAGVLMSGEDSLGLRPVILQPCLRICLSALVLGNVIVFWLLRCRNARFPRAPGTILMLFFCGYFALLLPGALMGIGFDRYALPLIPGVLLLVLHHFQHGGRRIPAAAWICLCLFAAYGVAITHDYASASRARVEAASLLEARGVPRNHVSAGLEYDGWTQLETVGTIAGATRQDRREWNRTDRFWFWHFTTALQPDYVVTSSQLVHGPNILVTVPFTSWLPPFERFALARRREDLPKKEACKITNLCLP